MPALLLAMLTVIQFALWAHAQHVALAAAQEGVAAARAYQADDQIGRHRAAQSLDRLGPTILRDPAVDVARTPEDITVTVTGRATSVLGIFTLGVREQARGPIERFVASPAGAR